jgi:sortase A
MRTSRTKKWISYLLFTAGAVLLVLSARDFLGSRIGQIEARKNFDVPGLTLHQTENSPVPSKSPSSPSKGARPIPPSPPAKPGETVAKLIIPRLGSEIFVVEGDGPDELRAGPGHLSDTAPPGGKGNCVIAGHRDTHFRVLKDIKKGDDIVIETRTGQFLYRVKSTTIVSPNNTASLHPSTDAELHLVTCYPFYFVGSAPKRFVVEARLAGAVGRTS